MCGICGFAGFRDDERLTRMVRSLVHRGPDDEGRYVEDAVSLAMRRLSVIDVAGGRQPIWNESRTIGVVMNGEIYNFQELRHALITKGHRFETKCDTEVLVHLYEDYGEACVEHLRGMFAFALWDRDRQVLLLARDRLGIKPLFYAHVGSRFWFASEIKALLAGGLERTVDAQALRQYLTFLYVPSPQTIFEGIRQLPPGHILTLTRGELRVRRYWSLRPDPEAIGLGAEEAEERLLAHLKEAIRLHLISDVPLGVFLSGGMDSTTLVALAGHGGDELFGGYPRYLGQRAGTLYDRLPSSLRRGLASASRWIPESVHSHNWPGRIRRFLEAGSLPADERYLRWITFLPSEWGEEALTPDTRARAGPNRPEQVYGQLYRAWEGSDPAERAMALDVQTYLPGDLLVLGDRMSMAHSLEVRVPFCDHVVAQFALGLPAHDRFRHGRLKSFLKKTLAPFLPAEVLTRSKQGFKVPLARWFNADLKEMVHELLSEDTIRQRGYVRYSYVRWLLEEHESGRKNLTDQIYALLVLEIWQRAYVEGRPV